MFHPELHLKSSAGCFEHDPNNWIILIMHAVPTPNTYILIGLYLKHGKVKLATRRFLVDDPKGLYNKEKGVDVEETKKIGNIGKV